MRLFTDPQDIDLYGHRLAQLLVIGGYQLESLAKYGNRVLFDTWAKAVMSESQNRGIEISPAQLRWLWQTLKTEPETERAYGKLMIVGARSGSIKVLPRGSTIWIELRNISTGWEEIDRVLMDGTKTTDKKDPTAHVTISDDLFMQRGKKALLECLPVNATLHMTIFSGVGDCIAEAARINADKKKVKVDGNDVTVEVRSLNESYTKASLRLETERRSHGGRIYDALYWTDSAGAVYSLGDIRDLVEKGEWTVPDMPSPNE